MSVAQTPASPRIAATPELVGLILGYACIALGGLAAAVTGPLQWRLGSWLAAYLVLVGGLAQLVVSAQRRILRTPPTGAAATWLRVLGWPVGNAFVVLGSLTSLPVLTDIGGVVLVAVAVLALVNTRRAGAPVLAWLVRLFYLALVISVPIGLVLATLRAA